MQHPHNFLPSIGNKKLELIGIGVSAAVYGIDKATVLKDYFDEFDEGIPLERRAFDRLGFHPNVVQRLGDLDNKSFVLERGQCLSKLVDPAHKKTYHLRQKLGWIRDAAEGLRHVHKKGIVHADVGCTNMVVIAGRVKIIDFGGCSIDGSEALTSYNWFNCNLERLAPPVVENDIFAFGCAVFQILTSKFPYGEYEKSPDRDNVVRDLYLQKRFPVLEEMPLRELILGCWHGSFASMDEVTRYLDEACIPYQDSGGKESVIPLLIGKARDCFRSTRLSCSRILFFRPRVLKNKLCS